MNPKHLITLILILVCSHVESFPFYFSHNGTIYYCSKLSESTVSIYIENSTQSHISVPSQVFLEHYEGNGIYKKQYYTVVSFNGCEANPSSLSLPSSVTIMKGFGDGDGCFYLKSVSMPNVHTIKSGAFSGCSSLTSVSMPNVKTIEGFAFSGCSSLKSLSIPSSVLTIERGAFLECTSLTSISMPNVQTIGKKVFWECRSLTSVSMPNAHSIGEEAFYACDSLKYIYIDRAEPPTTTLDDYGNPSDICDDATYKRARLIVPKEAVETYRIVYPWSKFFITEQMSIETYADFAPNNCSRRGFTADGLTKLWISTKDFGIDASDCTITASINGKIIDEPTLTGTIGKLSRDAEGYGFILTAPDGYNGPENSSSYTVDFELNVGDGKKYYYASVEVWRPGVILLHGLYSSSVCWSRARDYLLESGSYTPMQIVNASYKSSNTVSFDDNTYRYQVVRRNMDNLYAQLSAAGIASSRYDLVGHSMGGILSRKYAQEIDSCHVNRILTFDTPHSGSSFGILPEKLNIRALDVVLSTAGIKVAINDLLAEVGAVHDLNPSSAAMAKLNSPQMVAKAAGIPCHAVCNVFDGADPNVELDLSELDKGLRYLPTDIELPLWFSRLVNKSSENLSNQDGLDILSAILGENRHDGVVNYTSQRGGLREGSTATVFTAYYEGMLGYGSAAHHCNMTRWNLNLQRMLELLRKPKDDACFALTFAPTDLSRRNMSKGRQLNANEAPAEAFINLTAEQNGYTVNLHMAASGHVVAKGIMCLLDEDRVICADGDADGNAVINVPEDVEGELEFIAIGLCDNGGWVADVERFTFDGVAQPLWLKIETQDPMIVMAGQSAEIEVTANWSDDYSTPVKASLELVDANGIAEIDNGAVRGLSEGECRMAVSYRNLNDTITVRVIGDMSAIKPIPAESDSDIRLFTRGETLVAQFQCVYEGNIDLELYLVDGTLVSRTSGGGRFEPGDEFTMLLPPDSRQIYIARCRKSDVITSMKILY